MGFSSESRQLNITTGCHNFNVTVGITIYCYIILINEKVWNDFYDLCEIGDGAPPAVTLAWPLGSLAVTVAVSVSLLRSDVTGWAQRVKELWLMPPVWPVPVSWVSRAGWGWEKVKRGMPVCVTVCVLQNQPPVAITTIIYDAMIQWW